MSKEILIGDTHLGVKDASHVYHKVAIDLFTEVAEYAKLNNIDTLIHTGDFFDNRKRISVITIGIASAIGKIINEAFKKSYMVVGNHDTYYVDNMEPTSLDILEPFKNIHIIKKPTKIGNILLLPWLFNDSDMEDAEILIGHFDINGVKMNSADTVSKGYRLNLSDFSKYKKVYSGHYHTPGKYGNVEYVGTPYQITFNDRDSERGFYVLDTDLCSVDFVPFHNYPVHRVITDKTDVQDTDIKGNNIRLVFTDDYGIDENEEIISNIRGMMPNSLQIITFAMSETFTNESIDEVNDTMDGIELLIDFIQKSELPTGIKENVLVKLSESIYKETISEK